MSYKITNYSKQKAKNMNVEIKPSTNKNKKIDVFQNDKKIASIRVVAEKIFSDYRL